MVRYKKRYFVLEYDRAAHISRAREELDLEPLSSRDIDIANAVKDKVGLIIFQISRISPLTPVSRSRSCTGTSAGRPPLWASSERL